MQKKIKTYVIMLGEKFPKGHISEGQPTNFKEKFLKGEKIHTIRGNCGLWMNRMLEVMDGKAKLSIRRWTGKPYNSKQEIIKELTADDGVGFEIVRLYLDCDGNINGDLEWLSPEIIANNDGLTYDEWCEWFKPELKDGNPHSFIIIHFTDFQYAHLFDL